MGGLSKQIFRGIAKNFVKRKNSKSMKSREEIRFLALLNKSQEKAASLKNKESDKISAIIEDEWRVPKFVETLEDWLVSLEIHPQGPTKEVLIEYRSKVDFLKKVLESLKKFIKKPWKVTTKNYDPNCLA